MISANLIHFISASQQLKYTSVNTTDKSLLCIFYKSQKKRFDSIKQKHLFHRCLFGGGVVAPLYPPEHTVLLLLLLVHAHINPEKAAAPGSSSSGLTPRHAGPPDRWFMGPGLPSGGSWLVVSLAVTRGCSDEVLAHSHGSREGLQSHAAHSWPFLCACLWSPLQRGTLLWHAYTFSSGLC